MTEFQRQKPNIPLSEPREELLGELLLRLRYEQEWLSHRKRLFASCFAAVASGISLAPLTLALVDASRQSGFYSFLSLVFTDTSAALSNVGALLSSLLESLPVSSLALVLGLGLVFSASLQMVWREAKRYSLFIPANR